MQQVHAGLSREHYTMTLATISDDRGLHDGRSFLMIESHLDYPSETGIAVF
jgi:hypothetical protein